MFSYFFINLMAEIEIANRKLINEVEDLTKLSQHCCFFALERFYISQIYYLIFIHWETVV